MEFFEIKQNEIWHMNIFDEERVVKFISDSINEKSQSTAFPKEEVDALNWAILEDVINRKEVINNVTLYIQTIYDRLEKENKVISLKSPEVEINDIIVKSHKDFTSVSFCGNCACDKEHGISISFCNKKFHSVSTYINYESVAYDEYKKAQKVQKKTS